MVAYEKFTDNVYEKFGLNLKLYKEAQMKRRLTSLRNKNGFNNFTSYYAAIEQDVALRDEFIDRITINVSEFYRNPQRWDVLRDKIIPKLIAGKNNIRIWSAACSTGEEPYSLAILLKEHYSHINVSIIASDIDDNALNRAREGCYESAALQHIPKSKKSKYFTYKDNKYYVDPSLKKLITFQKHNLLENPYPRNIDLIVCRNVLIYFTDEAKREIYSKFSQSLVSNGVLFVGSTEQIFQPQEYNFKLFDTFFYEKKD